MERRNFMVALLPALSLTRSQLLHAHNIIPTVAKKPETAKLGSPSDLASVYNEIPQLPNLSTLRKLPRPRPNQSAAVIIHGYLTPGDGGGGIFIWDPQTSIPDNGGTTIAPSEGAGRWTRLATDQVDARWFGVKGDGITDDTQALQAALDSFKGNGGSVILPSGLKCMVNSNLHIPANCELVGVKGIMGSAMPSSISKSSPIIYLNQNATVELDNSSRLAKIAVLRQGIHFDISSHQVKREFRGTAITLMDNTADLSIEDCAILGFNTAIKTAENARNVSRIRLRRINIDCVNGVSLQDSYDVTYIDEIHCWPFVNVNAKPEPDGAQLKRPGCAIKLHGVNDWTKVTNCFNYGYAQGYHVHNSGSVTFLSCGADHVPGTLQDGSIGFLIDGAASDIRILAGQTAAKETGIYINTTSSNGYISISDLNVWETRVNGITIERGSVNLVNGNFRRDGRPIGSAVHVLSTASTVLISNMSTKGFAIGISNASSAVKVLFSQCHFENVPIRIINPYKAVLASAGELLPDGESVFFQVTGKQGISKIGNAAIYTGRIVTFKFTATLNVTSSSKLRLSSDFTTQPGSTLTLISDGLNWFEITRNQYGQLS